MVFVTTVTVETLGSIDEELGRRLKQITRDKPEITPIFCGLRDKFESTPIFYGPSLADLRRNALHFAGCFPELY